MKPGVYRGITNDDYHGGPGISKSGLDLVHKSPAHFRAVVTAANDNEPTPAQALGTALHALVLEPKLFVQTYTLGLRKSDVPHAIDDREVLVAMVQKLNEGRKPKLSRTGSKADVIERILAEVPPRDAGEWDAAQLNAMKGAELAIIIDQENENRAGLLPVSGTRHELANLLRANGVEVTLWSDVQAEWLQNNAGRIVLNEEQWQQLHNMRDAVMAHPAASRLLSAPGEAELSAYAIDPRTGQLVRVRPDYARRDGIMIDLKSCEDASPEAFAKSIANWRYHVQDPFYSDVWALALEAERAKDDSEFAIWGNPIAFVFIAVEKTACVVDGVAKGVAVYRLDQDSVALGRMEYRADLDKFDECECSGRWPGYSDLIQPITVPAWHFQKAVALATA